MLTKTTSVPTYEVQRRPGRRYRPRRSRRTWGLTTAIRAGLAVAFVALVGLWAIDGWTAYSASKDGQRDLEAAAAQARGITLVNADRRLAAMQQDFRAARAHFSRAAAAFNRDPVLYAFGRVPLVGDQIGAFREIVGIGRDLSDFGDKVVGVADNGLRSLKKKDAKSSPERLADFIQAQSATMATLNAQLANIDMQRATLRARHLIGPVRSTVKALDSKLNTFSQRWHEAASAFIAGQYLLGNDKPRTFLVLNMDPAELRSAGGYFGSFGFLHVDHGKIGDLQFRDVFDLHELYPQPGQPGYIAPPKPIAVHLFSGSLGFRDAGWWPDFPTTASMAERILERDEGTKVDGVIAINPYLIQNLLGVVGPVTVPFVHGTFDSTNFFINSILQSRLTPTDGYHKRKDFLGYIGKEIQSRLSTLPPDKFSTIIGIVQDSCHRRDVEIVLANREANGLVSKAHCDGALARTPTDFLLVDSAISQMKNNAWLKRSFQLTISRSGEYARHRLSMHVENHAPPVTGYIGPYYEDFLRVFIPSGSKFVGTEGGSLTEGTFVPATDNGYAEIDGSFRTQHNVFDITIVYDVPITRMTELFWERQSGAGDDPVQVTEFEPGLPVRTVAFALNQDRTLKLPLQH